MNSRNGLRVARCGGRAQAELDDPRPKWGFPPPPIRRNTASALSIEQVSLPVRPAVLRRLRLGGAAGWLAALLSLDVGQKFLVALFAEQGGVSEVSNFTFLFTNYLFWFIFMGWWPSWPSHSAYGWR